MPYRKRFQSPKEDCLCYNLLSPYKEEVLKTEELVSLCHVLIYQDLDLLDHLLCQTQVTEFSGGRTRTNTTAQSIRVPRQHRSPDQPCTICLENSDNPPIQA